MSWREASNKVRISCQMPRQNNGMCLDGPRWRFLGALSFPTARYANQIARQQESLTSRLSSAPQFAPTLTTTEPEARDNDQDGKTRATVCP